MERTNFTFVNPSRWLKALPVLLLASFFGGPQSFGQYIELACDQDVRVVLDEDCEREIKASLVLEGDDFTAYNLSNSDFNLNVIDGVDESGDDLDGPGTFIYEISLRSSANPSGTVSGLPCWGYVTGEDKTAPDLDCPDDTDEGTVVLDCFTDNGTLDANDLSMNPTDFSCFIDGQSGLDDGTHYYDLLAFQVDRTDYYTILVSDEFLDANGSPSLEQSAIALFQGGFDPSNPCEKRTSSPSRTSRSTTSTRL
ncbi:MAG: hypothetical protein J5I94_22560 [Phaeodactylibacter sp.]|nr:hypothetical protein [Phaeodactylibacter sp.]